MINSLLTGVFNLIIGLVSIILSPIDSLIASFLPDLSSGINAVGEMFALVNDVLGFCVSLTGLSTEALSLIVIYYTFKLTVPILISTIKMAINWYNALKP